MNRHKYKKLMKRTKFLRKHVAESRAKRKQVGRKEGTRRKMKETTRGGGDVVSHVVHGRLHTCFAYSLLPQFQPEFPRFYPYTSLNVRKPQQRRLSGGIGIDVESRHCILCALIQVVQPWFSPPCLIFGRFSIPTVSEINNGFQIVFKS